MKTTVVRSDQSPMNERRWCVELSCGHETWLTSARRPKVGKAVECAVCAEKPKDEGTEP